MENKDLDLKVIKKNFIFDLIYCSLLILFSVVLISCTAITGANGHIWFGTILLVFVLIGQFVLFFENLVYCYGVLYGKNKK